MVGVHPEYWTRRMYDRVKQWVKEQGGRLMYLGGNGLNCEVELDGTGALICRTYDDTAEPDGHESRMHRRHESRRQICWVLPSPTRVL